MNKELRALTKVLFVIFLIGLAFTLYAFGKTLQKYEGAENQSGSLREEIERNAHDNSEERITVENEEYNFQFSYPRELGELTEREASSTHYACFVQNGQVQVPGCPISALASYGATSRARDPHLSVNVYNLDGFGMITPGNWIRFEEGWYEGISERIPVSIYREYKEHGIGVVVNAGDAGMYSRSLLVADLLNGNVIEIQTTWDSNSTEEPVVSSEHVEEEIYDTFNLIN